MNAIFKSNASLARFFSPKEKRGATDFLRSSPLFFLVLPRGERSNYFEEDLKLIEAYYLQRK